MSDERRDDHQDDSRRVPHQHGPDLPVRPACAHDEAAPDRTSVLGRAFHMLDLVAREEVPMNLTEMSRRAQLPLPTTYRFAKALVGLGALARDDRGRYTLGPVWSEWAEASSEPEDDLEEVDSLC